MRCGGGSSGRTSGTLCCAPRPGGRSRVTRGLFGGWEARHDRQRVNRAASHTPTPARFLLSTADPPEPDTRTTSTEPHERIVPRRRRAGGANHQSQHVHIGRIPARIHRNGRKRRLHVPRLFPDGSRVLQDLPRDRRRQAPIPLGCLQRSEQHELLWCEHCPAAVFGRAEQSGTERDDHRERSIPASFGQATSTRDARQMQFGLKIIW